MFVRPSTGNVRWAIVASRPIAEFLVTKLVHLKRDLKFVNIVFSNIKGTSHTHKICNSNKTHTIETAVEQILVYKVPNLISAWLLCTIFVDVALVSFAAYLEVQHQKGGQGTEQLILNNDTHAQPMQ